MADEKKFTLDSSGSSSLNSSLNDLAEHNIEVAAWAATDEHKSAKARAQARELLAKLITSDSLLNGTFNTTSAKDTIDTNISAPWDFLDKGHNQAASNLIQHDLESVHNPSTKTHSPSPMTQNIEEAAWAATDTGKDPQYRQSARDVLAKLVKEDHDHSHGAYAAVAEAAYKFHDRVNINLGITRIHSNPDGKHDNDALALIQNTLRPLDTPGQKPQAAPSKSKTT